ncbi:MAG: hypothetical protein J6M47_08100 [Clostridia bacterium]|nr:hypothetical protein [Clostridia bacterium]
MHDGYDITKFLFMQHLSKRMMNSDEKIPVCYVYKAKKSRRHKDKRAVKVGAFMIGTDALQANAPAKARRPASCGGADGAGGIAGWGRKPK